MRVFALRGVGFCSAWCGCLLCVVWVFALPGVGFCSAWCFFLFALCGVGVCFDLGGVLHSFRYLCFHSDDVVDNITIDNIADVMRATHQKYTVVLMMKEVE